MALLQYTGGTTGVPKGAMLTHRNLIANTLQCLAWTGLGAERENERVLTPLPLYHIFSLTANLLSFAVIGGLNVLVIDPRDLDRLIRTIRDAHITAMSGVNTLFNALITGPTSPLWISARCASRSAAARRSRARWRTAGARSPAPIWSKVTA